METVLCFAGETPAFFSDHTEPALAAALEKANAEADGGKKEALLLDAVETWPEGLDGHIALYKFYFRTGRYRDAERAVWAALREAARQGGFTRNYRLLRPGDADWFGDHAVSRLYLFSLKALGVIRLRRERIALAKKVLGKLAELDPYDEVGGGAFLEIARSFDEDAG
jgi:hypothetical protein